MRISTNFCLSPFNQEPSYCDKILSKLDNYFYFGGKQVEIVGRNERTQEILCISSSGRHVPIAEDHKNTFLCLTAYRISCLAYTLPST